MPALLIETGFINSEEDNKLFDNKFSDIAQGIADAILGSLDEETVQEPLYYRVQTGAFRKKRMRTVCYISYWKKVIPLLCYMKTDCIKFRQVPISRLVMQ